MARPKQNPTNLTDVGRAVISLRRECGLSQQALSNNLHLSLGSVTRYELGRSPDAPSLARLFRFASDRGKSEQAEVFRKALFEVLGIESILDMNKPAVQLQQVLVHVDEALLALKRGDAASARDRLRHVQTVLEQMVTMENTKASK